MERNFMISIQFEGRTVYANVFEYRHSPAVYHVHFIDHVVPNQLKLYERDGEISADAVDRANPELVKQVVIAIRNNPNRV